MKNFLLILAVIAIPNVLFGEIIKENWTKDTPYYNEVTSPNTIGGIYKDSKGRIWLRTHGCGFAYKESYADSVWNIIDDVLWDNFSDEIGNCGAIGGFEEDNYGNWIGSGVGLGILSDKGWQIMSSSKNPEKYGLLNWNDFKYLYPGNNSIYLINNGPGVSGGRARCLIVRYDKEKQEYYYDKNDSDCSLVLPDSLEEREYEQYQSYLTYRTGFIEGDVFYILTNYGLLFHSIKSGEWFRVEECNNKTDYVLYELLKCVKSADGHAVRNAYPVVFNHDKDGNFYTVVGYKNYTNYGTENEKLVISLQVLKFILSDKGDLEDIITTDICAEKKSLSSGFTSCFIDKDDVKDSLLMASHNEMWFYNVSDNNVMEIPRPDEVEIHDSYELWSVGSFLAFPEKNELWIGTVQGGIFICDLVALLNSGKPVSVALDGVDIYNPLFPVLMSDKVFPLPSKGYTNIDFFQQLGTTAELTLKVYDIDGSEIPNIDYTIELVLNMRKRAKISTSNLQAGIYICQIKYNEHSCSAKFIVE